MELVMVNVNYSKKTNCSDYLQVYFYNREMNQEEGQVQLSITVFIDYSNVYVIGGLNTQLCKLQHPVLLTMSLPG